MAMGTANQLISVKTQMMLWRVLRSLAEIGVWMSGVWRQKRSAWKRRNLTLQKNVRRYGDAVNQGEQNTLCLGAYAVVFHETGLNALMLKLKPFFTE
jgi:hypothetical protein